MKFTSITMPAIFPARFLTALLLPLLFVSCRKENDIIKPPVTTPFIKYIDLENVKLKFGQGKSIDLNDDQVMDISFFTLGIGDPLYRQDKLRYYLGGMFDTFSLVNEVEESPVLNLGDSIHQHKLPGYEWYNASAIVLGEKIIPETGAPYWQGNWKNADHKYFPLQVRTADGRYQAWIEISFDTNTGELILHRAAIATEPGISIAAGR
jgi:hypothetical protein